MKDNDTSTWRRVLIVLGTIIVSVLVIFVIYNESIPESYSVTIGDTAPEDIITNRAITNHVATSERALEQAQQVQDVFLRSEEISNRSVARVETFFDITREERTELLGAFEAENQEQTTPSAPENNNNNTEPTEEDTNLPDRQIVPDDEEYLAASEKVHERMLEETSFEIDIVVIEYILRLSDSIYLAVENHSLNIANAVMSGDQDTTGVLVSITSQVNDLVANNRYYRSEYSQISNVIRPLLEANLVYDAESTMAAREAVFQRYLNDPILIPAGTRIVAQGEVIDANDYQTMTDLGLIETGSLNWSTLIAIVLLYSVVAFILWAYFAYYNEEQEYAVSDSMIILISVLLVFMSSIYLVRISPLLMPIYFVAIILGVYFGLRTALIVSFALIILLFPVAQMNTHYLFVSLIGVVSASMITSSQQNRQNYAMTILGTTASTFAASILYSTLAQHTTQNMLYSGGLSALNGFLSAIIAVGLSPIIDIFVSTVSPSRLITLADANQPILKRLFMEAPATYQHSMMVANLAEAAAERIGADTLLVRVGSYYHDIGKLWNPQMYTENQNNFNPHSLLKTQESRRIIFRHVSYGEQIAKDYGLPEPVIDFIRQHHGTTALQYFYTQACDQAEAIGAEMQPITDYQYPGPKPHNKEIAIVMLSDTVEAAMKSTNEKDIVAIEKLIRRLINGKVDQDQLVDSDLSFHEVEEIIQAYIRVYEGLLHERVEYPDDNRIKQAR